MAKCAPPTKRLARASPQPAAINTALATAAPVQRLRETASLLNARTGAGVAQRVVLHRIDESGTVSYYSDLDKGNARHATKEEAGARDATLSKDPEAIKRGLVTGKRNHSRQRRAPTPYSYMAKKDNKGSALSTDARVRHQVQGPHSLSFSSFERRLQHRLNKGQHAQLTEQIPSPEKAQKMLTAEYPADDEDTKRRRQRYDLDYRSLHDRYHELLAGDDKGVGSQFHLVTRKLMQLHPYTTYRGAQSTHRGEDENDRINEHSVDPAAKSAVKEPKRYEKYIQTRGDMYHSSDEETEDTRPRAGAPFVFEHLSPRERKYARKKEIESAPKPEITPPEDIRDKESSALSGEGEEVLAKPPLEKRMDPPARKETPKKKQRLKGLEAEDEAELSE